MKLNINTSTGKWLDKKTLKNGDVVKIVSEALEIDNNQGGKQIVAKIRVKGSKEEPANVAINKTSQIALVQAFGDDTKDWMNHVLTVHLESTLIAGKRGIGLYLIPSGFEIGEDDAGYLVIKRTNFDKHVEIPSIADMDFTEKVINVEDLPF